MVAIPIRRTANMLNLIFNSLTRLLPHAHADETVRAWSNEDSSWHSSSFELARGLEVIEHRGLAPPVFADTMPSCHLSRGMMAAGTGKPARS